MDTKGNATLAGAGLQHQILFLLSLSLVFLCNDEAMRCHREQDNPVKGGKENRENKVTNSTESSYTCVQSTRRSDTQHISQEACDEVARVARLMHASFGMSLQWCGPSKLLWP